MRRKLFLLIAIFAVLATACGSSATVESGVTAEDTEAADSEVSTESSDSASVDTEDAAAADEGPVEFESPLFDLLGFDPSSFEDIDWDQAERDRQLLVQECMVDLGFEYTPVDFSSFNVIYEGGFNPDEEWGTRAFAEKYGFGISTFFEEEISSYAVDFETMPDMPEDPNQTYLEFLSDGERQAWEAALYGSEPELFDYVDEETGQPLNPETNEPYTDEEMEEFWQNFEPSGCQNAGYDEAGFGTEETALIDNFFTEFENVFETMGEQMENDPRIASITDNWVRCMGDKSYSFTAPEDVWEDVSNRMEPIRSEVYGYDENFGMEMFDISEADAAAMTDEEAEAFFSDFQPPAPEITSEIRTQLDAVISYEIALAVADFDCNEGNDEIYQEVQKEIELNFIEENQGAITAFLEKNQG